MWESGPHGTGEMGMALSGWTCQGSESCFAIEGRKAAAMCSHWTRILQEQEDDDDKYSVISQALKRLCVTSRCQNSTRALDQILMGFWDSRDSPAALEGRISEPWEMISWECVSKLFQSRRMAKVQLLKGSSILRGKQSWETCETEEGSVLYFRVPQGSSLEDQPALRIKNRSVHWAGCAGCSPVQMGL